MVYPNQKEFSIPSMIRKLAYDWTGIRSTVNANLVDRQEFIKLIDVNPIKNRYRILHVQRMR